MHTVDIERLKEVISYLDEFIGTEQVLICGGAVRYLCGIDDSFRDIDVIVRDDFDLNNLPEDQTVNRYGGHKFKIKDKEIDLWKLKDHIIPCSNFRSVQETWLISSDALYYLIGGGDQYILYDKYYKPYPEINFSREIKDCEKDYINYKLKRIFDKERK